jgi:hypothetical protein
MRGDSRPNEFGPKAYASVCERITWTKGFTVPIDKHVLGTLATFANFKTGIRAEMRLELLIERSGIPRATLSRSLQRLKREGWVTARLRHRHPTSYDINLDRLATTWKTEKAKAEDDLSPTSETQDTSGDIDLSPTSETQEYRLSATSETQTPDLSPTSETPSPVRTDPQYVHDPQVTPLRGGSPPTLPMAAVASIGESGEAKQLNFGPVPVPEWRTKFAAAIREGLQQGRRHG